MDIPLEMHTSYITSDFPYHRCHRVVYHCRTLSDMFKIRRHGNEIVRVVFVVTKDFTPGLITAIADSVKISPYIDELSFRQMIDGNYQTTNYCYEFLKSGHKKDWWYIEQCDYNSYFVNGKIYYEYSKISDE